MSVHHPAWPAIGGLSGALCGLFAGLFFTPKNAAGKMFAMCLLAGTIVGFLVVYLPIALGQWSDSEDSS